jgi:hypothetical protein
MFIVSRHGIPHPFLAAFYRGFRLHQRYLLARRRHRHEPFRRYRRARLVATKLIAAGAIHSWTHAMTFVGLVLVSLPIGVAIRRESRTPPGRVRVFSITGRHHRTYIDPDAASPRTHGPGQSSVNGC